MRNTLKHSQVFLKIGAPNEKILENETTCKVPSSRHAANIYSRYFRKNLLMFLAFSLILKVFDVTEQLFLERPLYKVFLLNYHLPYLL